MAHVRSLAVVGVEATRNRRMPDDHPSLPGGVAPGGVQAAGVIGAEGDGCIAIAGHVDVADTDGIVRIWLNAYGIEVHLTIFEVNDRSANCSRSFDDGRARRGGVVREHRVADMNAGAVCHSDAGAIPVKGRIVNAGGVVVHVGAGKLDGITGAIRDRRVLHDQLSSDSCGHVNAVARHVPDLAVLNGHRGPAGKVNPISAQRCASPVNRKTVQPDNDRIGAA